MRAFSALLVVLLFGCGASLPYEQVGPREYHVRDASVFDEKVWAPKLCGDGVRYSYDKRRTSSVMETSTTATTTYVTEGTLVCDQGAPNKADGG